MHINPGVPPEKMNQTNAIVELKTLKNNLLSSGNSAMIDTTDMVRQIEDMIDKQYLEQHNHTITYLEKEKYYKTYVDRPEGSAKRYKQLKSKTLEGIQKKIVEYYQEIETKFTLHKVFYDWLDERVRHHEIEASTKDRMETDFKRFFVSSGFDTRCIDEISERELSCWIKDTICENNLTRKAWANLRCIISGIFKYAKELGYTSLSISHFLSDLNLPDRMFRKTFQDPDRQVFTDDELQQIIHWIQDEEHPERMESLSNLGILLCIFTGLRSGELSSLKFSDVSEKKMKIARTQTRHKGDDDEYNYVVREETKGKSGCRYIAIPPVVHTIVDRLRKLNPDSEYMFTSHTTGQRMKAETFSGKLERICKYLNIPIKRLHKIRKTYATMLLDAGVPESIITNQMGHTDISTTLGFYYKDRHSDDEKVEAVTNALDFPVKLIS